MEGKYSRVGNCQCWSPQPGKWVKGKLIGSGSFGTVHLAISKSTGGLFVVKQSRSDAGLEALENEVKILKSLKSSPYIVQCLGIEKSEGNLSVLMEYMAGGSVADVAQKFGGSLEEEVVRLYTREMLKGLKYLHHHGIVHCDIKCKNVLLGSSGDIKLADFGCAKRLEDLKGSGGLMKSLNSIGGTPLWMAPEVLRNERLDSAADIWSLGCTVIEMATGRPPWGSDVTNPMAALLKIARGNEIPQFPSHFSKEGLDFLAKCLERDPAKRWTADKLLNHPFVSGKSRRSSQREHACSPSSVLEVQRFDDGYDSDEAETPEGDDFSTRKPFTWRHGEGKATALWPWGDSKFGSSGNWIAVRSG
ncbi:hypothetical protein L6164_036142 [Bauhinia variegata]|uniref:Uncharacterized protein n=1 Tax=Bauhinia variegata TaxID=167791 RepID=A0ACB9KG50_BAUVA|nr:hypothetical protein L6164_036142 [Bauhinia variegata]